MKIFIKALVICVCVTIQLNSWAKDTASPPPFVFNLVGVDGPALANVHTQLTTQAATIDPSQPDIVRWRFFQAIPQEVNKALQPYGYFKATVHTRLVRQPKRWHISITIHPGPRLKFSKVAVHITGAGSKDPVFNRYLHRLPAKVAHNFNSEYYVSIKTHLQHIASSRGYFNAKFITTELRINLNNYTSAIIIQFDTGPRFRFGQTHFSASPIKSTLLTRYLLYRPGQFYQSNLLNKSRDDLGKTTYFKRVTATPDLTAKSQPTVVPIYIDPIPQDRVSYTFGAGYGTNTGVRGLASMQLHWLNASGHHLSTLLRGSQTNSELATSYFIPGRNPATSFYAINGGLIHIDQPTGKGNKAQAGISYQTQLGKWQLSVSLNELIERYFIKNYPIKNINTSNNANVIYPQVILQRNYAYPTLLNPSHGYNIIFTAAAGSNKIGSESSFFQYRLDTSFLYTIQRTKTRLMLRGSIGAISIKNLSNLPLSMLFFAGGTQSIRGFDFNSIGPGFQLIIGNIEIQQRIFGHVYVTGFIDAGNVSDNIKRQKLNVGSGPGIMYLSPIGAIEVTAAKVISISPTSINDRMNHWLIQFSMGTSI